MPTTPHHSDTLLDLYRNAQTLAVTAFAPFAMGFLQRSIAFDSAMFGLLSQSDTGAVIGHYMHVHNEDSAVATEWKALAATDPILRAILADPGRSFSCQVLSQLTAAHEAPLLAYARRRGHLNVLAMALPYGADAFRFAISLRRADPDRIFSDEEGRALEALLPHVCEAFRINQSVSSQKLGLATNDPLRGICIFDNSGTVIYQDDAFGGFAKAEFSDYEGFQIPARLREAFCGHRQSKMTVGNRLMQIRKIGDFHFLSIRALCRLDALTERELAVARYYGTGLTNKEIGVELGISPFTARKHIEAIYVKLKVNNKADLAYLIHASPDSRVANRMFASFEAEPAMQTLQSVLADPVSAGEPVDA